MSKIKSKPQNFETSAVILLFSTVLVKLIGAIFKIPLSRLIGDLGFGYFSSAYDLFLPIYSLSMAGLPIAVSKIIAENVAEGRFKEAKRTLKIAQRAFLVTGITGFVLMLLLTYPYAAVTTKTETDLWYICVCVFSIAPALLFCCIMSSYRGYFEGFRNMFPTAISDVIESLGKLAFGFGLAYFIFRITGNVAYAAAGALAGVTLGTVFAAGYIYLRYKIKGNEITKEEIESSPEPRENRYILKTLIMIAVPVVLSSLASNITLLIDTTMVKWQLKNVVDVAANEIRSMYALSIKDYNSVYANALTDGEIPTFLYGIRGKAYTLYNLIPTLTSALGIGAIPTLATSWTKNDKTGVKSNIDSIIRTTAIIALPAGLGVSALSRYVMGLLYKGVASVEIGSVLLFILGIAAVFSGISVPITSMLQAIGKPMVPVINIAVGACLKVLVNFLLVGRVAINIKGAPIGTTVCYMYIFIANIFCLIKYTKVKIDFMSAIIKPLISALICAAVAYLASGALHRAGMSNLIIVALSMASAAVVYIVLIFALRTLNREDICAFPKGEKLASFLEKKGIIR